MPENTNPVALMSHQVSDVLNGVSGIYAVILLGSCSRGEESYFIAEDGERQLLSDYELMVVTEKNEIPRQAEAGLRKLRADLRSRLKSPFFDLEWNYYGKHKLPFMDKRFIHFEMKTAGKLICGNPRVFDLMPKITVKNLNFAELDSIVNHRLYHVLKSFGGIEEHQKKYLIARNTLDVTSVVLPFEGKLICSYEKRIAAFPESLCNGVFGDNMKERLNDYLAMKKDYLSAAYEKYGAAEMLEVFLRDMSALYEYQKTKQMGKAFCQNRRARLKGVLSLNRKRVSEANRRPDAEDALFHEMYALIRNKDFSRNKIDAVSEKVFSLYHYR